METQNEYMIKELKTALLYKAPFFASIMFERSRIHLATPQEINGTAKYPDGSTKEVSATVRTWRGMPISTAMTDGYNIVFNPEFLSGITLSERIFVACHEVFHLMARHPRRFHYYSQMGIGGKRFDHKTANIAADAVINKCLRDASIGKQTEGGVHLEQELYDNYGYTLLGTEAWETVYDLLVQGGGQDESGGDGDNGTGTGTGTGDDGGQDDYQPDVGQPGTAEGNEASETEMKASINSAAKTAKSRGELPGSLKTLVDELVEPKIPWTEILASSIKASAEPDSYDWSRANRRRLVAPGIYLPRRVGVSAGNVVASVDTSGSVSDKELQAGISELSAILSECRPDSLRVIWCDARVDRVDELDSPEDLLHVVRSRGVGGRGGTSFVPPFEHIRDEQLEPDIHIYITDGYAPFPDESMCDSEMIWLITSDIQAPFGQTIKLDV